MRAHELLEKRSNPELNNERHGHATVLKYLERIPDGELDQYGISMTQIPKLGINPQSKYETPIGVYFYPARYYFRRKQNGNYLPFQDNAEYIQLFKFGGNVLDLQNTDVAPLFGRLNKIIPQLSKAYGISGSTLHVNIDMWFKEADSEAKVSTAGGKFWYLLWKLSGQLSVGKANMDRVSKKKSAATHNPWEGKITADTMPLIWNKLFRLLGISAAIDMGYEIIHENEPTQGVVFDPSKILSVKTFENKAEAGRKVTPQWVSLWNKHKPTMEYVREVSDYILMGSLSPDDDKKYGPAMARKISEYCIDIIKSAPGKPLPERNFRTLARISQSQQCRDFYIDCLYSIEWDNIEHLYDTVYGVLHDMRNDKPARDKFVDKILDDLTIFNNLRQRARQSQSTCKYAKLIVDKINALDKIAFS